MHEPTLKVSEGDLLPQDEVILRSLQPRRRVRSFAFGVAYFSIVYGGIAVWSSGSWKEALSPVPVLMGAFVAGVNELFGVWQSRRLLRRTSNETRDELRRDWRFLTGRGWLLRVAGLSAGVSAFFVTMAVVLTGWVEPIAEPGGFWREIARMFGFGMALMFPVILLLRFAFKHGVEKQVSALEMAPSARP
jgi:hypothetical protein